MNLYLGVDPGKHGGLAALTSEGDLRVMPMPDSDWYVWTWILEQVGRAGEVGHTYGAVEKQTPRPTTWYDKPARRWQSSILKSTCLLYGSYTACLAYLTAAKVSLDEPLPQRWQRELGITPRGKDETDTQWKNRLKARAQQLFPRAKVTLAVADAILLAEYCRRLRAPG